MTGACRSMIESIAPMSGNWIDGSAGIAISLISGVVGAPEVSIGAGAAGRSRPVIGGV